MLIKKRAAKIKPLEAIAIIGILVLAGGLIGAINLTQYGIQPIKQIGIGPNSTSNTNTIAGTACSSTQAWQVQQSEKPYGSDTLAGTQAVNGFAVGSQNIAAADLTGTSVFTSAGTYPPNGQFIMQYTETSTVTTYPVWANFNANGIVPSQGQVLATTGGIPTATLQCTPSSANPNSYIWTIIATPIQAPTSGTSATTYVKNVCIMSTGASLTTATTAFPSAATLMTCNLQILQNYKGLGYTVSPYGTASLPLTNYATGQVTYSQQVPFSMVAVIVANQTGVQVSLDPSATGLSITPVTGNTLATATKAWIVSGWTGCAPAPGSASTTPFSCISLPIDTYTTGAAGHVVMDVYFVDMQQVPYVLANMVTLGITSFGSTTGSNYGAPTGFSSGLTPTTGNDAGAPAPLIKQYYGILNVNT